EPAQTIAGAEYYIDTPPWSATATPIALTAADGSFDSDSEAVSATIDVSNLAPGEHIVYVRGKDADGNWGPVTAEFLDGSLKVTISPQGAVDAGAQWQADSGSWQNSGYLMHDLDAGTHTVTFKTISGWTAPPNQAVDVGGQTVNSTGTYTEIFHQVGSLKVTISPQRAADAGIQWQADSGSWQDSGTVVHNLGVGTHTVTFKTTDGWTAPPDQTVNVGSGQTAESTGTYIPHPGSLEVTILPQGAVDAGAQWKVDSGSWQNSGTVVPDLDGGTHTVTFKTIAGWTAPPDQAVNVSSGQTVSVTGTYTEIFHQTGSLKVTISPRNAANEGAQWQVDSGSWHNSETVVPNLDVGTHTVTFKATDGWTAPPDQTVDVSSGQTVDSTGTYVPHPNSLKVTILPRDAADAGAQWQIDGGSWQNSGTVVPDLDGGTHTVTFKTIDGWIAPRDQTVNVINGQTVNSTGTYGPWPVSVKVAILPQGAADAGAQWKVGKRSWQDSGTVANDLNMGTYTVAFKTTDGWTAPPDQTVSIGAGETKAISGTYTEIFHQTGSLEVTISPQNAADAGAQWQVDSGSWQNSGTVVPNLGVGTHTVAFKTTDGWTAPPDQTVDIGSGQTVSVTGTYTEIVQQTGSLKITLSPQGAIDAGAQWQIDSGSWQDSGTVVPDLGVGAHTVTLKTTDGWTAPPDQTVNVSSGQTVNVTG
ncbi:MAG: hypothetical protein GY795_11820, partial [Desulfobacterales bacterium]|nr:hypothetical protein [Desulfobacterales bacterium]